MEDYRKNRLLSALPEPELQRLSNNFEKVELSANQILLKSSQKLESLYFPLQGIVSLISIVENNCSTEIGLIGSEGVVGILQFLGEGTLDSLAMVQVAGTALKIDAQMLRAELNRSQKLQKLFLQYVLKLYSQVSQDAACNNHHSVRQRTACKLLMLDDRSVGETLLMTQQSLSLMLGVRRTGISEIACQMMQQGIIYYQRGKIKILNRPALEKIACGCYQIVKERAIT